MDLMRAAQARTRANNTKPIPKILQMETIITAVNLAAKEGRLFVTVRCGVLLQLNKTRLEKRGYKVNSKGGFFGIKTRISWEK